MLYAIIMPMQHNHNKYNKFDLIIIGAGAAGLMCAITAASRHKKVAILDHSLKLAEKIRISGGGRCNFTNLYTKPECYISNNPHFCKSALASYTPQHFTTLLDKYNIEYHEKTLGQLFCNHSAADIINLFDYLCKENNVCRHMGVTIDHIEKPSKTYEVHTNLGIFNSETLVIATGGLSIPLIGATSFGYNIAKQFGLKIIPTAPALVPLTLSPPDLELFAPLSGTSFMSEVSIVRGVAHGVSDPTNVGKSSKSNKPMAIKFQESTLLTHRGLSGPAILQVSSYWQQNDSIMINVLPNFAIQEELKNNRSSNKLLSTFLAQFIPQRLSASLCDLLKFDKPISQLTNIDLTKIHKLVHELSMNPSGTLGYKKAEVTKGGVDCNELSSSSMMSKNIDGLYFIGEVVDVTGWLGGYNFQWAWASGYKAGMNV
jgi:predicted Rossmann fold flavoprotein